LKQEKWQFIIYLCFLFALYIRIKQNGYNTRTIREFY
jgi:hypothetical protein